MFKVCFRNCKGAISLLLVIVLCCQFFAGCGTTAISGEPSEPESSTPSTVPTEPSEGSTEPTTPTTPSVPATEPTTPDEEPEEPQDPQDPHTYGQWVILKAASCTATGSKSRQCTTCGYESVVTIAKTEHNMIAGTCSVCGYSKVSTGITFRSYGNGTCCVDDLLYCYDKDVVIPTHSPAGDLVVTLGACLIDDVYTPDHRSITIPKTVTKIEPGAFRQGKDLEHLYVHPDNPVFLSVQDCVIEKETGTLVAATKNCVFPTDGSLKVIGAKCFDGIRTLTSITIPSSVHTIEESAFFNTGIVNLVIPDTVTNIDSSAFGGIKTLQSVRIGSGVKVLKGTFHECPALKSVTFTGDIEVLEAFSGCSALEQIDIPESVVELGGFDGCTSLKKISIPSGVQVLYRNAFANCAKLENVIIPDGIKVLPAMTFYGCSSLKSVTIPDSVTTFEGWSIFNGCSSLKSIHIPEGVEMLDKYVFTGCSSLEHVVLPRSMRTLGDGAFSGCSGMKTLTVGDRLWYVASDAFAGCSGLDNIYASHPENMIIRVEGNCLIDGTSIILGSANSVIPDNGLIKSISWDAFQNNKKITHIEIPEGVEVIHRDTFAGCSNLQSVTLPAGLRIICEYAFKGCVRLTEIKIPDTVTRIEEYAFEGCTGITECVLPASLTVLEGLAFRECANLTRLRVADGNTTFHSAGNCVIETQTGTLVLGCSTSVIPNDGSVKAIGTYAFVSVCTPEKIVIPQSVTTIERYAFFLCDGLKEVTIEGEGVTLKWNPFERCYNVMVLRLPKTFTEEYLGCLPYYHSDMTVYYAGTIAEWKATPADQYYTGKIICSDGIHQ